MVNRIISEFLGPFVVILQYTKTRTGLITLVFALYLLMYALGLYQLRTIRQKTDQLIIEKYQEWIKTSPGGASKKFFKQFIPQWEEMLSKTRVLYILNKHDLWPVRKSLKNVLVKFPLDQEYVQTVISKYKSPTEE